jgi:alpha-tubulin suppressor-like RCC1 family protein
VINISTGDYHTCALTSEGRVRCWGRNVNGELGNGTATPSAKLESVVGLAGDVRSISSGWEHTCVLTGQGGVQCWGRNAYGALGNGTTTDHLSPVEVAGLSSGVSAISTGLNHTCIVMNAGGVKCWGLNWNRQLGNGMAAPSGIPVDVVDLATGVKAVAAGDYHTCALKSQGGVKCWGWNGNGELGDSTMTTRDTPVDVKNMPNGINAITTGGTHTCALTSQGGVKCWGRNVNGELGNGTNAYSTIPVEVAGLTSGVNAIAAGGTHTCALTSEGGVKCWGGNLDGQLGNDSTTDSSTPVDVVGLTIGVSAITTGDSHTCVVTTQGSVKCWGRNRSGELGTNSTTGSPFPVDVVGLLSGVRTVEAGQTHTCALMDEGGVKCWGGNLHGQLGNGTTVDQTAPVEVTGLSSEVSSISAGGMHTCALTSQGGVKCWGDGSYGQLANGPLSWTPVNLSGFIHPLMIYFPSVLR